MPRYEITTPQGRYEITVPEGTTQEQAYGYLQQQQGQQPPTSGTVPVQGSIMGDIGTGLARAGAGTLAGIGDVLPHIPGTPSTQEARDMLREFAAEPNASAWGTAGEVAGNTLPFLLAPEVGLGRLAIRGLPYAASLGGLVEAYRRHGIMGVAAPLMVLAGIPGLGHFNPKLLALARGLMKVAPTAAKYGGAPLERLAAGAGTTYLRSQEGGRPQITIPRRATDGETEGSQGAEPRGDRKPSAPTSGPPVGATGGRGRSNDAATDQRPESRWVDPNYFPQTERGNP